MQIAISNEIYLLDLLHFFHTCDAETVQLRLANRLFDDDHVTLLCKNRYLNFTYTKHDLSSRLWL